MTFDELSKLSQEKAYADYKNGPEWEESPMTMEEYGATVTYENMVYDENGNAQGMYEKTAEYEYSELPECVRRELYESDKKAVKEYGETFPTWKRYDQNNAFHTYDGFLFDFRGNVIE